MVARHIDDAGAFASLSEKLLNDIVVSLRPVPALTQLPAVDNIAHEIDRIGVIMLEKIKQ